MDLAAAAVAAIACAVCAWSNWHHRKTSREAIELARHVLASNRFLPLATRPAAEGVVLAARDAERRWDDERRMADDDKEPAGPF